MMPSMAVSLKAITCGRQADTIMDLWSIEKHKTKRMMHTKDVLPKREHSQCNQHVNVTALTIFFILWTKYKLINTMIKMQPTVRNLYIKMQG